MGEWCIADELHQHPTSQIGFDLERGAVMYFAPQGKCSLPVLPSEGQDVSCFSDKAEAEACRLRKMPNLVRQVQQPTPSTVYRSIAETIACEPLGGEPDRSANSDRAASVVTVPRCMYPIVTGLANARRLEQMQRYAGHRMKHFASECGQ